MLSTNCINCCFNTGGQCSAIVGADEKFARQCTFKKTYDELALEEYKACAHLAELANTSSGRARLYDYFLKYDSTVELMKRYGFSSVVSLVNQI
jgi:hypothetical protein